MFSNPMEQHQKHVYQEIVESDENQSTERTGGMVTTEISVWIHGLDFVLKFMRERSHL